MEELLQEPSYFTIWLKRKQIIAFYDTIVLDEIQTIKFQPPEEVVGALKGYLESGEFRVMGYQGRAEAGLVLLANIPLDAEGKPKNVNLFETLPNFFSGNSFF